MDYPSAEYDASWSAWSAWQWSDEHSRYFRQRYRAQQVDTQWDAGQTQDSSIPRTTGTLHPGAIHNQQPQPSTHNQNYLMNAQQPSHQPDSEYSQDFGYNVESSRSYEAVVPQVNAEGTGYHQHLGPGRSHQGVQPSMLGTGSSQWPSQGQQAQPVFKVPDRKTLKTAKDGNDREVLDPSYQRVKPKDISNFFREGRVLAMLWSEPAKGSSSAASMTTHRTAYSVVEYGQQAFTEIRRFIVVKPQGAYHSICVPIVTYGKKGVVQRPDRKHHSIAYTGPEPPEELEGEDLDRHPIKIEPRGSETLHWASRINFSKVYTVEHNCKVKAIGNVPETHFAWVTYYWQASMGIQGGHPA